MEFAKARFGFPGRHAFFFSHFGKETSAFAGILETGEREWSHLTRAMADHAVLVEQRCHYAGVSGGWYLDNFRHSQTKKDHKHGNSLLLANLFKQ